MKKIHIKQGVSLYLEPNNKFKTYFAGLFLHTPLEEDTATENALLPLVLKRGCERYPTLRAMTEALDMLMGASFESYAQKQGDEQLLAFAVSGVGDAASPYPGVTAGAVGLLFDMVTSPLLPFRSDYLEGEKKHLAELIETQKNDKRAYAASRCIEELCRGEAYAVPEYGFAENLPAITPDTLEARYRALIHSSPIDIVLVGAFDEESLTALVREKAEKLPPRNAEYPPSSPVPRAVREDVIEPADVSQGKLCLAFSLPVYDPSGEDYPAMLLYNSIFGGGAHSKLFLNVREKLSLAYYAGSSYRRGKGLILVSSGIESTKFDAARSEIFAQHRLMTEGDITDAELTAAKESIAGSMRSSADAIASLAAFYLNQLLSGSFFSPEEMARCIENVKKEDICRVAKDVTFALCYFLKGADR